MTEQIISILMHAQMMLVDIDAFVTLPNTFTQMRIACSNCITTSHWKYYAYNCIHDISKCYCNFPRCTLCTDSFFSHRLIFFAGISKLSLVRFRNPRPSQRRVYSPRFSSRVLMNTHISFESHMQTSLDDWVAKLAIFAFFFCEVRKWLK